MLIVYRDVLILAHFLDGFDNNNGDRPFTSQNAIALAVFEYGIMEIQTDNTVDRHESIRYCQS